MQCENKQKNSMRVLVVDDDFTTRLLYREALEPAGFKVIEAEDGITALEKYQSEKPDIILLDVIMPVMDGFEACKALRKLTHWPDTPIILVTGLDDLESIEKANQLGATDFITKPINWPILKHRLNFILKASHAFKELKIKQKQLNNAQRIAKIGSWEWDVATQQGTYSQECLRICNISQEDALQLTPDLLLQYVHNEDRARVKQAFLDAWKSSSNINIDNRLTCHEGIEKNIRSSIELIRDQNNKIIKLTGTVQDISETIIAEEKIRHLAYYDSLTGLPNRQLFREHLKLALKQAARENQSIYIMFLDMDNFKHVNDSLGHDAGDRLLKEFTLRLQQVTRDTDYTARSSSIDNDAIKISRLGGDEFTVLLQNIQSPSHVSMVAKRIIQAMSEPFEISKQDVFVSTSVGISVYPNDGDNAETLLKHADVAMYHAKMNGKNNYQFFDSEMNLAALNRLTQENALRNAIHNNEFVLHYQPRVQLCTGRIVGVEALIRWNHPELGLIQPNDFIPLAEESRLIVAIGKWVLKTACEQIKHWSEDLIPAMPISVNISPYQFADEGLQAIIVEAIKETGINPALLELEITESALMKNLDLTVELMKRFRAMGVRLAIDDFGTGYSVLNTLKLFPLDVLKIDQSFIQGLPDDKACTVISEAIIHMARGLTLDVVAEGVETEQQLNFLKKYDCIHVQGYLFSRPATADEIAKKLRQNRASLFS